MSEIDPKSQRTLDQSTSTLSPAQRELQKQITEISSSRGFSEGESFGIHAKAAPAFFAGIHHQETNDKAIYGEKKHYPLDPRVEDLKKKFDDTLTGPQRELLTKFKTERGQDLDVTLKKLEDRKASPAQSNPDGEIKIDSEGFLKKLEKASGLNGKGASVQPNLAEQSLMSNEDIKAMLARPNIEQMGSLKTETPSVREPVSPAAKLSDLKM